VKSPLARLDRRALRWFRTRYHSPAIERTARRYALAGEYGAIWVALALTGAVADPDRSERWLRTAALVPAALGANYLVKLAVRRPRPRLRGLPPIGRAPRTFSFPSGHATTSFAAALASAGIVPASRVPLLVAAALMAVTRPYLGLHYPSDVVGGALLGSAIGLVAARGGAGS
jgi:membrane-associated phospholipid phosphatase